MDSVTYLVSFRVDEDTSAARDHAFVTTIFFPDSIIIFSTQI